MPAQADRLATARVSVDALAQAIEEVEALDLPGRLALCDEIAAEQPNLLFAILATIRLRSGVIESDLLLKILMVSFQAMRHCGAQWALIPESEQERQLARLTGSLRFAACGPEGLRQLAESEFVAEHPEPMLLAYVLKAIELWLQRPEVRYAEQEADKYILLAAINTVQCIAYGAPLAARTG
jgi:hypothetical protein